MKRVHALKASALRHDGGAVCAGPGSSIKDAAGSALSLRFWGVRGSIPVTGPEHRDFGSNTACIEVVAGNHLFVVDAGSGIVPLGKILRGTPALRDGAEARVQAALTARAAGDVVALQAATWIVTAQA